MTNSAKLNAVTELERAVHELGQQSGASEQLAEHLADLLKTYDMDTILKILEKVTTTKE